jgi:hypothetical protein
MIEVDWLACKNPQRLLSEQFEGASERKLRLLACACVRDVWHLLSDRRSREAVEVAERYADGLISAGELQSARSAALLAAESLGAGAATAAARTTRARMRGYAVDEALRHAAWAARNEFWHTTPVRQDSDTFLNLCGRTYTGTRAAQCDLVREVLGNPFRVVALDPDWLVWDGSSVSALAETIYNNRAFEFLPVLARALEGGGCDNTDILNHCRGGRHVRGCWVVDLLLGKS